jgi:hypothetical protein
MSHQTYQNCIEACTACAVECEHCGDACLGKVEMADCARACRDCADLCWICSAFMSRGGLAIADLCHTCALICDLCAAECGKHPNDHCRRCADACRRCAEECRRVAA